VNLFWAIGIGVNLAVMAAVVVWAVRNWRRSSGAPRPKADARDRRNVL
jgi:hypothetical protein